MDLRLVPPARLLPSASKSPGPVVRRPGELLDAIDPPSEARDAANAGAYATGVAAEVLLTLLVERQLALGDLRGVQRAPPARTTRRVTRPLTSAEAAYLRTLKYPSPAKAHLLGPAVAVPVRVLGRLRDVDWVQIRSSDARGAVEYEVAALLESRTIAEWLFLQAP